MALNARQRLFVAHYIKTQNATESAKLAGYSEKSAHVNGSRLLEYADIKAAIEEQLGAIIEKSGIDAAFVIEGLRQIADVDIRKAFNQKGALLDIHSIPEDIAKAISSIEVFEEFEGFGKDRTFVGTTTKIKFWDKVKALELLGKYLKIFTENVDINVMTYAECIKQLNEDEK